MPTVFKIAYRYIFSQKYRFLPSFSVFLAFFGIFLSILTLVVVISVMNGFKTDFERLIIGTRPHVTIYPQGKFFTNHQNIKEKIEEYPQVLEVQPVINGEGVISFDEKTTGILIKGVQENYFQKRPLLSGAIIGEFKNGGVVVGIEIANKLGIKIGDTVTIISSKMRQTLFGSLPLHKNYVVSGFFKVDMYAYDSTMAFIDIPSAQNLVLNTDAKNAVNAIEIVAKNSKNTDLIYEKIIKSEVADGYITNWRNDNQSFIDAIATQTAVMFLILSLFLIVASFIMFSTLANMVQQKRRSVAILQSFGMSKKEIVSIFALFGMLITLPAIVFGVVFGCVFSLNIDSIKNALESLTGQKIFDGAYYFLSYIPSVVDFVAITKITIFSIILCTFAIIIPAIRASKILPQEALRFE